MNLPVTYTLPDESSTQSWTQSSPLESISDDHTRDPDESNLVTNDDCLPAADSLASVES